MRIMKNKGFTLVELLVVFTIMLMLATLSVAGVLAYQDYADFKRENSYAQTLFSAAQNKMTQNSVRGQMGELSQAAMGVVEQKDVILQNGMTASQAGNHNSMNGKTIYYLMGSKESYRRYLAGEYTGKSDTLSRGYVALYHILEGYLYDQSILNAAIAVEYDPAAGIVYSVFYSDKVNAFTYTEDSRGGLSNICDRRSDYRSTWLIGYYGLD